MFKFPVYDNTGAPVKTLNKDYISWDQDYIEIRIDKIINSKKDLYNYLNVHQLIEEKDEINSINKIIDILNENKMYSKLFNNSHINTSTQNHIARAIEQIPPHYRDKYIEIKKEANKELLNSFKSSCQWIFENKIEIIDFLNASKNAKLIEYKNKKSQYNATYREKLKKKLDLKDRVLLTDEQKAINRKISDKKYQEKIKLKKEPVIKKVLLTNEQKAINKKIANAKYREKIKNIEIILEK